MVRENIWRMKFFPVQGKVREFRGFQGNLERTWKVREFENKWIWQVVFRKFILVKRGKDVHSQEIV